MVRTESQPTGMHRSLSLEEAMQRTDFDKSQYICFDEDGHFAYMSLDSGRSVSAKIVRVPIEIYRIVGSPEYVSGTELRQVYGLVQARDNKTLSSPGA